jgi:hypothetical protein
MVKRYFFPFLAAVLLAASFSGTARAAGDGPALVNARGEVLAVNPAEGSFRIETPDGATLTFSVNEETSFRGQAQSLDELQQGWKVGVVAREGGDGALWAVLVISGDPEDFIRARGTVTDVNISAGKFTIEKPDGANQTFFVDEHTRYGGRLQGLEDLQEGWKAGVVAVEGTPGKLLALGLVAGDGSELIQVRGRLSSVNSGVGLFEIETPQGEMLQIHVDRDTRYHGQVADIGDLKAGMGAGVAAVEDADGRLLAKQVVAGNLPIDRPQIVKGQGVIHSVSPGAGKFTLEKSDGTRLTVYVDSKTRYRGQVGSFDELEKGMKAGFAGYLDQEGKSIARIVLAGDPRQQGSSERPQNLQPGGEMPGPDSGFLPEELLQDPLL